MEHQGDHPTILVVDDDARNRDLVRAYLEPAQRVIEAEDAPSALAALSRDAIDLVLLDVMMPGISGFEACRQIKARSTEFLPVILLTALSDQEDRNAGLEAGADEFLSKPVDRRELRLRVATLLRIRQQEQVIRQQCDEMRKLDALKNDLISLTVHDLRNPLAGLLGFLSLLGAEARDEAVKSDVEQACRAARKLQETLDDLLQVRMLEEGRLPLQPEPCRISDLVEAAIATVEGAARHRGVAMQKTVEGDGELALDVKLVRRALENLFINAIKYSPSGSAVEIFIRRRGSDAEIEVADRGPGIPDGVRLHLFEKFGTVHAHKKQTRGGFGLGLYLVQLVAGAHGGRATAEDRAGGGTVFRLLLKRHEA